MIVLTLCDICMPEAFCEFETVRKKGLSNLWVLWEKNSPASLIGLISSSGCVQFLTEKPERTEHTGLKTSDTHRYADYI